MSEYKQNDDGDLVFHDGNCGWGDEQESTTTNLIAEVAELDRAQEEHPVAFKARPARAIPAKMKEALVAAHKQHALAGGGNKPMEDSVDLRMIFPVLYGALWMWPRQIIGSCVASGGMRVWGLRSAWEVACKGDPEELIGKARMGRDTVMPYGPYNYGVGRRLGNMRRGDGSYCSVHIKGFQRFGVVDCSTPLLHDLVKGQDKDYPEPQSSSLYRSFGSWKYLDQLKPYADYPLLESEKVTSANRLKVTLLEEWKGSMICSGWGFGPSHKHKDGFWVYKRKGSWSHNMSLTGWITASDGDEFVIVLNSWGSNAHRDGEVFVIPAELCDKWLRNASCMTVGEIDLPDSVPAIF